ncbi:hypothetical protein V6172_03205, partial [Escherichia coli]|uniref:hypothetical protein n=1 Tax=Escherichia coli TaxID=562 RepID=UPI003B97F8D7
TDGDGSHGSTSKTPSYTKSVSWHHYPLKVINKQADGEKVIQVPIDLYTKTEDGKQWLATHVDGLP